MRKGGYAGARLFAFGDPVVYTVQYFIVFSALKVFNFVIERLSILPASQASMVSPGSGSWEAVGIGVEKR